MKKILKAIKTASSLIDKSDRKNVASVHGSLKRGKKLPTKIQLIKAAVTHPITTGKVLYSLDKAAVAKGKMRTGKDRWGQAKTIIGRSEIARDLTVNVGGYVASVGGGSVGGPVGSLVADNLGAVVARKGVNQVYARHRAKQRLGKNATKEQINHRQKRYNKALERLDKRKSNNLSDQVGWGIGNTAASAVAASGLPHPPFPGAIVALRTAPSIVDNIKKVRKGELSPKDFLSQTGKDIGAKNNIVKAIREGNQRELKALAKINKKIGTLYAKDTVEVPSEKKGKFATAQSLLVEFAQARKRSSSLPTILYSNFSYA